MIVPFLAGIFSLLAYEREEYEIFDPSTVCLVDKTDHLLFRGNIPRNEAGIYAKAELLAALRKHKCYPKEFDLMVISLLTFERDEEADFYWEMAALHSEEEWMWHQVRAHFSHTPPFDSDTPHPIIYEAFKHRSDLIETQTFHGRQLRFHQLIEKLHTLMHTKRARPLVIYVHCRHGINRSSAISIGYLMRQGYALEYAWALEGTRFPLFNPHELYAFLSAYDGYLNAYHQCSPQCPSPP